MHPYRLFLCLIASLLISLAATAQLREKIRQIDHNTPLKAISFSTPKEGFFAATEKMFWFTPDSLFTYEKREIRNDNVDFNGHTVNLTFGFIIDALHAFGKNELLIGGEYGGVPAILHSADNGQTFKLVFHHQAAFTQSLNGISKFVFPGNGNTGFAISLHHILRSTDRGKTWQILQTNTTHAFKSLSAPTASHVFVMGRAQGAEQFYRSTDGGNTWTNPALPLNVYLGSAAFPDPLNGWVSLEAEENKDQVFRTRDGGVNWQPVNDEAAFPMLADHMHFADTLRGWAAPYGQQVYRTTDGGRSWDRIPRDNDYVYYNYPIDHLYFFNNDIFWTACGDQLQINTSPMSTAVPVARFSVDTTGFFEQKKVRLRNASNTQHKFRWRVDGQVRGTSYDLEYDYVQVTNVDDIELIAYNDLYSDSTRISFQFPSFPEILDFEPKAAGAGDSVRITGHYLWEVTEVTIGGTPVPFKAYEGIVAVEVLYGVSGTIVLKTGNASAQIEGFTFVEPPVMTGFSPKDGKPGDVVAITGEYLTNVQKVTFGGLPARSFRTVSPQRLEVVLGDAGDGAVELKTPGGRASLPGFRALPVLQAVEPMASTAGSMVTLTGSGLDNATSVTFGGQPAMKVTLISPTQAEAQVPEGAGSVVRVTKAAWNADKSGFRLLHAPVIRAIRSLTACPDSVITLSGEYFSTVAAENVVTFGGLRAEVVGATATSLQVVVPKGCGYTQVDVALGGLVARSSQYFVPRMPKPQVPAAGNFRDSVAITLDYPEQAPYWRPQVLDIDQDGYSDLLYSGFKRFTNYVDVKDTLLLAYLNSRQRASMFTAPVVVKLVRYLDLTCIDITGDGLQDLVVRGYDGYLHFYENISRPGSLAFKKSDYTLQFIPGEVENMLQRSADFDGDGKLDLIFFINHGVYSLRNLSQPGRLRFERGEYITLEGDVMEVADMNADGKPDVAGTRRVLVNRSRPGRIQFALSEVLDGYVRTVGDAEGDGKPEIFMLQGTHDYKSNSTLVYGAAGALDANAVFDALRELRSPYSIRATGMADVDHDGRADLLALNFGNLVTWYRNLSVPGKPAFAAPAPFYQNKDPFQVPYDAFVVDFDRDGRQDILVESPLNGGASAQAAVWFNDAAPLPVIDAVSEPVVWEGVSLKISGVNFTGATAVELGGTPARSFRIVADTLIEMMAGEGSTGPLTVSTPAGTAAFTAVSFGHPPVITSIQPLEAASGATVTIRGHHLGMPGEQSVFFGTLPATIVTADSVMITVKVPASAPDDYIYVNRKPLTGRSVERFSTVLDVENREIHFGAPSVFACDGWRGQLADLDGDGRLDVFAPTSYKISSPNGKPSTIEIMMNRSTLDSIRFEPGPAELKPFMHPLHSTGDFDGDGRMDLVTASLSNKEYFIHRNTSTPGNLSFAPPVIAPVNDYVYDVIWFSDMDKDGKTDLILQTPNGYVIRRNISDRMQIVFEPAYTCDFVKMFEFDRSTNILDIDGDGKDDFLYRIEDRKGYEDYKWAALLNESRPGKLDFRVVPMGMSAHWGSLPNRLGDMDGDGKPELLPNVMSNAGWEPIYRNLSTPGNIRFERTDWSYELFRPIYLPDLNMDGMPDRITMIYDKLRVERNDGAIGEPVYTPQADIQGMTMGEILTGDLNGDDKPEIIVLQSDERRLANLYVYPNRTGGVANRTFCENAPATLTAGGTGNIFRWQRKSGDQFTDLQEGGGFTGTDTRNLTIDRMTLDMSGQVFRCRVDDVGGVEFHLTIQPEPVADAGRDTVMCESGEPFLVGAPPVPGYAYKWQTWETDTLSYLQVSKDLTGLILLTVTDRVGCKDTDSVYVDWRLDQRAEKFNIGSPYGGFCQGSTVTLTAQPAQAYVWYKDGVLLPNEKGQTLAVSQAGLYEIAGKKEGCPLLRNGGTVKELPAPPVPRVTQTGDSLRSSFGGVNSWYRDGELVELNGRSVHTPEKSGVYTAQARLEGCISALSNTVPVKLDPAAFSEENVTGGPNPVDNIYHIRYPQNTVPVEMTVYGSTGAPVTGKIVFTESYDLAVGSLNKGMYFVHLVHTESGKKIVLRFIKP